MGGRDETTARSVFPSCLRAKGALHKRRVVCGFFGFKVLVLGVGGFVI